MAKRLSDQTDQQKYIEELKSDNQILRNKVKLLEKNQVLKSQIHAYLEKISEFSIDTKILTDISDEGIIILGRPPVTGSSKKQMRHVTPYSFVEKLIKMRIKGDKDDPYSSMKACMKFDPFFADLSLLLSKTTGLCLTLEQKKQLNILEQKVNITGEKKITTSSENSYFLIKKFLLPEDWKLKLNLEDTQIEELERNYKIKYTSYLKSSLEKLQEAITDENTFVIALEAMSRMLLTVFNKAPYTAFPEEGNTVNYEIRIIESKQDTIGSTDKTYRVINAKTLKKITSLPDHSIDSIRIVNNEGSRVKKAASALTLLDSLFATISKEEDVPEEKLSKLIEQYNVKYNAEFILTNEVNDSTDILKQYNEALPKKAKDDIINAIYCHIAKHLYLVFDYKPLEEYCFVPDMNSKLPIEIFPSAKGIKKAKYSILEGVNVRKAQENSVKAGDYTDEAKFRSEVQGDLEVLKKKALEHFEISISLCTNLLNPALMTYQDALSKAFTSFIKLINLDYTTHSSEKANLSEVISLEAFKDLFLNIKHESEGSSVVMGSQLSIDDSLGYSFE